MAALDASEVDMWPNPEVKAEEGEGRRLAAGRTKAAEAGWVAEASEGAIQNAARARTYWLWKGEEGDARKLEGARKRERAVEVAVAERRLSSASSSVAAMDTRRKLAAPRVAVASKPSCWEGWVEQEVAGRAFVREGAHRMQKNTNRTA